MAYAKQTWVKYDASKSEEENIQNGAVGTAERLNHMESGIEASDQLADKHIKDKSNPHSTTAAQVGLGSVSNYGIATITEATTGAANNKYMTPFLVSEALKSTKETLNKTQMSKVTANNGQAFMTITNATLLDSFVNQGPGFYTFVTGGTADAPPEVPIRGFVNMTREGIANVFAVSDSGNFYFRFLENNKWKNDWQRLASTNESQLYQTTSITTQDWDIITKPGIYYVTNSTGANRPFELVTTMFGYLEVITNPSTGNAVTQRFTSFNNEVCIRRYAGSPIVWKEWQKLAVSNDQETPLANLLDGTKFKEYSTSVNDKLTVRRSGNVIQICGTLTPTTTITAGETTIFKAGSLLPSWARPRDQLVCTIHHGTNVANFLSRVSKEGDILIGRYSEPTTNSPIAMTAGVWLPINIVYIV